MTEPTTDAVQPLDPDTLDTLLGDVDGTFPIPATTAGLTILADAEDLAALYVDGALRYAGTHYDVYLKAAEIAGIFLVESDAFLLGRDADAETVRTVAADDLSLVHEYEQTLARTRELREQAAALLSRAEDLETALTAKIGSPADAPAGE